jgi:phosphoglycerate dehydrogenase-like enzyme
MSETTGVTERLKVLWRSSIGSRSATSVPGDARLEIRVVTDRDEAESHRDWAQALVDGNPRPETLDGASLRHVVVPYAGVSAKLREAVLERAHLTLSNSHFNAAFVAQHAVALLLACCNRIVEADHAMRRGDWGPRHDDAFTSLHLGGKTALLLGYGAIGREIEKRLRGLGVKTLVYRRHPTEGGAGRGEYGPGSLNEALGAADVLIVSLPATPETRGLLDGEALEAIRPGAVLVNVGRGDVIDEWALQEALLSGKLRGAGLDVWWRYPETDAQRSSTLPATAPLHKIPTVVMSPHRANQVADWEDAAFRDVLTTLHSLANGKAVNLVDPRRGY